MTAKHFSQSLAAQRVRLLQYLQKHGSITTLQARQLLAVMHPAGRIKDLRRLGYPIATYTALGMDSAGAMHRQGLYVLQVLEMSAEH